MFGNGNTLEQMLELLERDSSSEFCTDCLISLRRMSPTSLKVTRRQLMEGGRFGTLAQCLKLEHRLMLACFARPDFYEGVRALLVDKVLVRFYEN